MDHWKRSIWWLVGDTPKSSSPPPPSSTYKSSCQEMRLKMKFKCQLTCCHQQISPSAGLFVALADVITHALCAAAQCLGDLNGFEAKRSWGWHSPQYQPPEKKQNFWDASDPREDKKRNYGKVHHQYERLICENVSCRSAMFHKKTKYLMHDWFPTSITVSLIPLPPSISTRSPPPSIWTAICRVISSTPIISTGCFSPLLATPTAPTDPSNSLFPNSFLLFSSKCCIGWMAVVVEGIENEISPAWRGGASGWSCCWTPINAYPCKADLNWFLLDLNWFESMNCTLSQ